MRICVQQREPTEKGALYPRYVKDAEILAVQSRVPRDWPFGVDIDGRLIFDIDADRILANFDLHIPKRYWIVQSRADEPRACQEASLEFTGSALEYKSFSLPLQVRTDAARSYALIEFDKLIPHGRWLALSEKCLARVDVDCLTGFFVRLDPSEAR